MRLASFAAVLAVSLAGASVALAQSSRSDPNFVPPDPDRIVPGPQGGGSCPTPPLISSLPFSSPGDTCGGTNTITNYGGPCDDPKGGLPFPYPGPEDVFAITVGASQSLNISASLTGSAGDLALFLLGTCGSGPTCIAHSQDAIGPGAGPETIPPFSGQPAGTYYIYIDSYYAVGSAGACGTYTLNVSGTLPVELESFQIN
jgi:hypothetical protein